MILVDTTFWPLVVVGTVPDSARAATPPLAGEDSCLWLGDDLRLAVVIAGDRSRASLAQEEMFAWLARHRDRLWRCASRVAWILEDDAMRQSFERWLVLAGDRLFRGEVTTFRSMRSAVAWLASDESSDESSDEAPR